MTIVNVRDINPKWYRHSMQYNTLERLKFKKPLLRPAYNPITKKYTYYVIKNNLN